MNYPCDFISYCYRFYVNAGSAENLGSLRANRFDVSLYSYHQRVENYLQHQLSVEINIDKRIPSLDNSLDNVPKLPANYPEKKFHLL